MLGVTSATNETFFIRHMFPHTLANAMSRDRLLTPGRDEQICEDAIKEFVWDV